MCEREERGGGGNDQPFHVKNKNSDESVLLCIRNKNFQLIGGHHAEREFTRGVQKVTCAVRWGTHHSGQDKGVVRFVAAVLVVGCKILLFLLLLTIAFC